MTKYCMSIVFVLSTVKWGKLNKKLNCSKNCVIHFVNNLTNSLNLYFLSAKNTYETRIFSNKSIKYRFITTHIMHMARYN